MNRIGLIGGMSFESTAVYYRLINEMVREKLGGLASADIVIHSLNFAEVVAMQKAGRWDLAAAHLAASAGALEKAGASCALICTNTMHLVAGEVQQAINIPLINIIDETAKELKQRGLRRPLLLATRYTMEQGFYSDRMAELGLSVMVPDEADRIAMHDIIFSELCVGRVLAPSRQVALAMIEKARAQGADSVILGCTEICLLLDPAMISLPVADSTTIHARAAVDFTFSADTGARVAA